MHLQSLMAIPALAVTLTVPHAYSVQDLVLPEDPDPMESVSAESTREFEYVEIVNPEPKELVGVVGSAPKTLYPELVPVCACESRGNPYAEPWQFLPNGEVIRGHIHSPDTGMCQINAKVWDETAVGLGYDIETEEGNIQMANHIYEQHGLQPWSASKHCWSKVLTLAN